MRGAAIKALTFCIDAARATWVLFVFLPAQWLIDAVEKRRLRRLLARIEYDVMVALDRKEGRCSHGGCEEFGCVRQRLLGVAQCKITERV